MTMVINIHKDSFMVMPSSGFSGSPMYFSNT